MKKANFSLFDHMLLYTPTSSKRKPYRSTQIIATIPQKPQKDEIIQMIEAGMNIARFNASNGKEDLKAIEVSLAVLREAVDDYNEIRRKEADKQNQKCNPDDENAAIEKCPSVHIATALDLKGIFYQTGTFTSPSCDPIEIIGGNDINLTTETSFENNISNQWIYVDCPFLLSLQPNQTIIVDKFIKLRVLNVDDAAKAVQCRIEQGGNLKADTKMEVNIPGLKCGMSSLTDDTLPAINFCKKNELDILIAPINDPSAFAMIKCTVNPEGSPNGLKVIAKLEGEQAVKKVDKIIEKADGVMISRGRLGRNISPEQVIVYQKNIIAKCLKAGIPSIVASDVLKSMEKEGSDGTRAEISDIVNMVLDGTDCVMLDEGASSKHCVETMRNTIMEAEDMINYRRWYWELMTQIPNPPVPLSSNEISNAVAISACTAAMVNGANAIIVLTDTGRTVKMISKYRPECPIIAVANSAIVARQVLLVRGVFSICLDGELQKILIILDTERFPFHAEAKTDNYQKSVEERVEAGIQFAKGCCLITKYPGAVVAVMASDERGKSNSVILFYNEIFLITKFYIQQ